ncbi:MAG: dTMP kinase [Patescibacteria group bacterium]|jgi:dTMP kinase
MKKNEKKGLLISFEGGEGGGKSVQIARLADEFRKKGKDVVITREPGGTVISEQIREVVLSAKNIGMAFTTEVLLFQAARAQIYRELILPSLKAEKVVLCDRTRDSSLVYQGIVRGFGEELIEQLNTISTQNTYPDVTILLDVPVEVGLSRRAETGKMDRLDMEQKDFHEKVRAGYLKLAKKNDHDRWIVIDASKSIEAVHEAIVNSLQKKKIL